MSSPDIEAVRSRVPLGWDVDEIRPHEYAISVLDRARRIVVTVHLGQRRYCLGYGIECGGRVSTATYVGRGWLDRLVSDAVGAARATREPV